MKVVHLSITDFWGYGKSAYRLHKSLQKCGIDSKMLVFSKLTGDPSVKMLMLDPTDKQKIKIVDKYVPFVNNYLNLLIYILNEWKKKYNIAPMLKEGEFIFSGSESFEEILKNPIITEADILHIHWAHGMIDFSSSIFSLTKKLICITLYDMYPFTGGCHFSGNCDGYKYGCDNCYLLQNKKYAKENFNLKKKFYNSLNIHIIATSSWIKSKFIESNIFEKDIHKDIDVIPPLICEKYNYKYSKNKIRQLLMLPEKPLLAIYCGSNLTKSRINLSQLIDAISIVNKKLDVHLILLGAYKEEVIFHRNDVKVYLLEFTNMEEVLGWYFKASDIFVNPLIEGNISISSIEAMNYGLPVVSYDIGGMKDIIEHKKTGYLAKLGDVEDFAKGIMWVLDKKNYKRLSLNSSKRAKQYFSAEKNVIKYIKIYNTIIAHFNENSYI